MSLTVQTNDSVLRACTDVRVQGPLCAAMCERMHMLSVLKQKGIDRQHKHESDKKLYKKLKGINPEVFLV